MAKPIPLTIDQRLDQELAVFQEQSKARAKIAKRLYDVQDGETKEALDSMVERIVSISRGIAAFKIKGKKYAAEVSVESTKNNALYLATEILKDLAMLDIRVANFRFNPKFCASCGKQMKAVKKKGKR